MSIGSTDLVKYSAEHRPTDDTSTSGGAIDLTFRPVLTQLSANSKVRLRSDGTDTRTATVLGRDSAGSIITEDVTLNSTTIAASSQTFERVHEISLSSASTARTVTVLDESTNTLATLEPGDVGRHIMFQRSVSSTAQTDRHEKEFWRNNSTSLSLLSATVELTADPGSKITIGLEAAVDGSSQVEGRTNAPSGISFVDDNVEQSVASTDLAAGSAQGVWIRQRLAADAAAAKNTYTTQLSGQTV